MTTCRMMSPGGGGHQEKMKNLMAYLICELFLIIPIEGGGPLNNDALTSLPWGIHTTGH